LKTEDSFESLKTLFETDLAEKIRVLETAICDANWETIGRVSHQISGTAESFGYPDITDVAVELERSVGKRSLDYSADLVKRISELFVL